MTEISNLIIDLNIGELKRYIRNLAIITIKTLNLIIDLNIGELIYYIKNLIIIPTKYQKIRFVFLTLNSSQSIVKIIYVMETYSFWL